MTTEEKAKAYDEAMERARKELKQDLHESGIWAIQRIFPELRESEDEITRKRLINLIRELASATVPIMTSGYFIDGQDKRYIAYLEKQKEEKLDSIRIKCKEHDERREEIMVTEIIESIICVYGKTQGEFIAGYDIDTLIHWVREAFDCLNKQNIQKEQKPAECIEDSVKFEEGFKAGRESGLRDGQKYVLNNLDSYGLCKPAEWSEEDEKMRSLCIAIIQSWISKEDRDRCLDWLKSIRPDSYKNCNSRWSEEDEEMIQDIIAAIDTKIAASDFHEMERWLKSLRPSWKPSEWQMSMLLAVINDPNNAGSESCYLTLKSIYEQLKKL